MDPFKALEGRPFIPELHRVGLEPDQRIIEAVRTIPRGIVFDGTLFVSLHRLNVVSCRSLPIQELQKSLTFWRNADRAHAEFVATDVNTVPIANKGGQYEVVQDVFSKSVELARPGKTFGVGHFLRAVIQLGMEHGDDFRRRPNSIDLLAEALSGNRRTPLSELPELRTLLQDLELQCQRLDDGAEDFQYILALEGGRIVFRVVSVLDDYVQASDSGLLVPRRALLTHFRDQFGGFTEDEIRELEELLNSGTAPEEQFQSFFDRHPHFLRTWDYREVYSHVVLTRPDGDLIPDFILTDREVQRACILELKLPRAKIIRRQPNRDRFASAVIEAQTQLFRYRDWFRTSSNREQLGAKLGMEVYEPRLTAVIGRSSEFRDGIDRQRLSADFGGIEVLTYDDILALAKRRRVLLRG